MSSTSRRRLVAAASVVVVGGLLATIVLVWRDHRRDEEWAHGGDGVAVSARIVATPPSGFGDALAAAGVPREPGMDGAGQMLVARVTWAGTPGSGGSYQFILLDDRVDPPLPVRAYGGWRDRHGTGTNWAGAYEVLADHYPWLVRTAAVQTDGGWTNETEAVGLRATESGDGTLAFWLDHDGLTTRHPERDLLLAMVLVDADGDVRWARQVPLTAP